ncbi:MAG TPA: dynamin family protein [Gemmataceae bacterium]|nr:dynamin family protein [Gemmataceae bacterium]
MNYRQAEERAAHLADGLEEIARVVGEQLGLADEARKLDNRARQVRDDRFRVLVVGEFKRGKSTLLNALLGDDILPRKVAECTAVVTVIQYGVTPQVRVSFDDGRPDDVLPVEEFRQRYELTIEDSEDRNAAMDRFSHVDHAVVSYPVELCRHRIELVDSPGLGAHRTRSQRTQKFLPQADAIVFVLYAPQFLKEDESHFLENVLLPLGLRNIFFVINGWNLIDEAVIRPEDADRERAELERHIRQRLTPFCVLHGRDLSAERIFRVNALGALRGRMRRPPSAALLEESGVPPFEEALQRFLVEDRGKARTDVILGAIRATCDEVNRFITAQQALASKSLAEIEAEQAAVQPKLERLRGIRQHIVGFLQTQSVNLQDRLVISFQNHIKKIQADLPAEVEKFDWSEINKIWMVWESLTGWTKAEEDRLAKRVERCIKPQVQRLLEQRLAVWQQAVVKNEMQAVMIDVDKHLQEEAAEYQRVMQEIEERLGIHSNPLQIKDLVERWLGHSGDEAGAGVFELSGVGAFGDMGWLLGSIALDVVVEVFSHMVVVWIPVVGAIITLARLAWREASMHKDLREKIVQAIREGLTAASQTQAAEIRARVQEGFQGLMDKIAGNIDAEVAIIDASLQSIIDRKKKQEFSAEQEQKHLEAARAAIAGTVEHLQKVLAQA